MIDRVSLAALDAIANDYESAASVCDELSAFLGEALSEAKLFSVLRSLEAQGLVQAYRATPDNQTFAPTPSSSSDPSSSVWFNATSEGRRLLEREWETAFGNTGAQR